MGKQSDRLELVSTKDFNKEFLAALKLDQVLGFVKHGEMQYWKVAKIDKKRKQWWLQPWKIYTDEEFAQLEHERVSE